MSLESYYTASRTKPRLNEVLSIIYDIRYTTIEQLKSVKKPSFTHIVTRPSFAKLQELKVLSEKDGIFSLDSEGYWQL